MRSYAQNNEDLRLWNVFKDVRGAHTYIDIGAGHPTDLNVTKIFYDAGWSGINIEPGPNYDALLADRPRDMNIKCAISNVFGTRKFYVSPIHPDLSSLEGEGDSIMVETLPLR